MILLASIQQIGDLGPTRQLGLGQVASARAAPKQASSLLTSSILRIW